MSYPPGFDIQSLSSDLEEAIMQEKDNAEIRYRLTAVVNDEVVYYSEFSTTEALQEEGIRKAEGAVEDMIAEDARLNLYAMSEYQD